jgi:predicted enzyme related to lactoylglutathione lyase
MTAVCIPYHAIEARMTDCSNGANVPRPARDVGEGGPVATATDPDGSVRRVIQDKEVIHDG